MTDQEDSIELGKSVVGGCIITIVSVIWTIAFAYAVFYAIYGRL